jgi:ergothioneine biosynthesis protein EgtB
MPMESTDVLMAAYAATRETTERLCSPLETEDYVIQAMTDVSPPKWHLGHTTWFFERVILQEHVPGYAPWDERYYFVFNSYYQSFGDRLRRDIRGTLSRPSVSRVYEYRKAVDDRLRAMVEKADERVLGAIAPLIELGIHHEQQHQELLVTDIKYNFATAPFRPAYNGDRVNTGGPASAVAAAFLPCPGGLAEIGHSGDGFAWDNERPQHKSFIEDFALMNRPVTCGEYVEFIRDRGYSATLLWLSDGWDVVTAQGWRAPLFWEGRGDEWQVMTLSGLRAIDPAEPVTHLSYYEADAFARWAGARLPTEEEWEHAHRALGPQDAEGTFLETGILHPRPAKNSSGGALLQMLGDVWEWTGSAYRPYPGFRQAPGALGEYNGKFMSGQMVLRGGSCATPRSHIRPTYRNFFQPDKRWQFTGMRLARDSR